MIRGNIWSSLRTFLVWKIPFIDLSSFPWVLSKIIRSLQIVWFTPFLPNADKKGFSHILSFYLTIFIIAIYGKLKYFNIKCFHLGFYHLKIKQKHLQRRDIFLAQWFSLNEKIFLTRTCGKMSQYCEDDHNNIVTILLQYHHNIITIASQYCHKTVRMTTTSAKRREIEAFWRFAAFLDKDISNTVDFSKVKNIWRMMRSIWLGRSQTQKKQR